MSPDTILWYAARAAALAAFFVLAASLLTGMAIRTAYLAPVARNSSGSRGARVSRVVLGSAGRRACDGAGAGRDLAYHAARRAGAVSSQRRSGFAARHRARHHGPARARPHRGNFGAAAAHAPARLALDPSPDISDVRYLSDSRAAGRNGFQPGGDQPDGLGDPGRPGGTRIAPGRRWQDDGEPPV